MTLQHLGSGQSVTVNISGPAISAAGSSQAVGTIVFSNSNGVSFGMNGSTVTASAAGGGGNVAFSGGTSSATLGTVVFSNSNGVSFGLNGSTMTASIGAGGAAGSLSAGTASVALGQVVFSNSNGISFGLNGSTVTAQHNALTTAMASNRGSDFVQATAAFAGTSASGTIASNGISISIGPYITTAMLSNAATLSNIRVSGGTTSNLLSALTFADSNGVSFGLNAGTLTATVRTNYLTTAMLSNAATISNLRLSAGTTSNLLSAVTFADGNNVSFGLNGSTMTASASYSQSTAPAAIGAIPGIASITSGTVFFQTGNGISFGVNGNTITASHNALTTARASNDGIGLATAQTNATWTVNSAGLSLNAGGYAGTASGFTGANISGSVTLNTSGLSLSLSVAAPGAAAENNWVNLLGANTLGNTTASGSTLGFSAGPGLTLSGTNGSQIVFSVGSYITTGAQSDHSHGNPTLALTNLSGTTASASNGFTLSLSAGAAGGGYTASNFKPEANQLQVVLAGSNASMQIHPYQFPNLTYDRVAFVMNNTNSSNSSGSHTLSFWFALYTRTSNSLSLYDSGSTNYQLTHSGTAGIYASLSGLRVVTIPRSSSVPAGAYWLAFMSRTSTAGANGSYSLMMGSQINSALTGMFSAAANGTVQFPMGRGVYTASASSFPNAIPFSDITGSNQNAWRMPIIEFMNGTA